MTLSGPMAPCDLLIRNAHVLTIDAAGQVFAPGAIAIREGRICDVGEDDKVAAQVRPARTIDAHGGVVHPGFIDAHVHISQYTSRSALSRLTGTSATMGDWKSALTDEDEHASAALAAVDYLLSGYTGFVDPGTIFEPDAVAVVAEQIGIRIWLTDPYVADLGPVLKDKLPELASDSFLARWPRNREEALSRIGAQLFRNRQEGGLVRAYVGLYGEGTDSPELFAAALHLARSNGVQIQKHLGYAPELYRREEAALGRSMIEHLAAEGHLTGHTTFIHMNVVHAADIPPLASCGVALVWCPYGQLQMLGRGGAESRMVELARAGVPIGIGSDIPRVTHVSSLGTLAIGGAAATGAPISGAEILRMRTLGAATSVGAQTTVGSIEIGKCADLVIRKAHASEHLGLDAALEFGAIAGPDSIAAVLVNGRTVVKDGELLTADAPAIAARAHRSAHALLARVMRSK